MRPPACLRVWIFCANRLRLRAPWETLERLWRGARGREMRKQDLGFDYHRYRQLLAEAVDESRRMALIDLLIEERARERLEAERASDRAAMTARTIATVLGSPRV